ncbi:MAG: UPF0280 family protein [Thermodesulfobacteriota bacterium]|nr:UPF0280 family protein [Thermodesulfobacteriota bacterium]
MIIKRKKKKLPPASFKKRTYRKIVNPDGLIPFEVKVRETDLQILATADLAAEAYHLVFQYRNHLESYISGHPDFLTSLTPLSFDSLAPPIIKDMQGAGRAAGVGPMAAVAGAIAEFVGRDLLDMDGISEVVVENGGDIFMHRTSESVISIFSGTSALSYRIGIRIDENRMPVGICTSSGTVGHSLSLGSADSVTVLSRSVSLADAAATRLGNEIMDKQDISKALDLAKTIPGLIGVVVILGREFGAWGDVELAPLSDK